MTKRGKFIVIDGLDASGKTTLIENLKEHKGFRSAYFTREPGGTEFSENIRSLVFKSKDIDKMTELLCMYAARNEHLKIIKQKIESGIDVVCDRYRCSSFLYQSEVGYDKIIELDNLTKTLTPDFEVVLYTDYETYLKRKSNSGVEINRLDPKSIDDFNILEGSLTNYMVKYPRSKFIDTSNYTEYDVIDRFVSMYKQYLEDERTGQTSLF